MKNLVAYALVLVLLAGAAHAQTKISQMPPGNAPTAGDTVPIVRGGVNYGATMTLGSTTTAGLLQCGSGVTCSGGIINGASYPTQTNNAFLYLMTNGSGVLWSNPASLVDPRTYGATCLGANTHGGVGQGGSYLAAGGTGYVNATYSAVPLTGGTGTGAQATIVVSGGAVSSVTISAAGSNYSIRDTLSASNTNLGSSGSGFAYIVGAFNGNANPVYPGTDDTAGFQNAFAVALATGQGVLVPNGCWVTTLNIPQGISMIGTGWNPNYGFNTNSGTATNPPILYSHGGPARIINTTGGANNAFVGFEINGYAAGGASFCIGSSVNAGGGAPYITVMNMSFKGCSAGVGDTTNQMFVHSYNNDYGANNWGIFGNMSDLVSSNDNFSSEALGGIHLSGGAGLVRIANDRFEFSPVGIEVANFGNINIDNSEFDHLTNESMLMDSSASSVYISNSTMQASGANSDFTTCHTSGPQAAIVLSRTSSTPANLHVVNTHFDLEGTTCTKYILSATTTGADNDYLFIEGGDGSGYTTAFLNSAVGTPAHTKFNTFGTPQLDSTQTTFTTTGCTATAPAGNATGGTFTSGTSGTCTVVITPNGAASIAQPHGWACGAFSDLTTNADTSSWQQTATTATTATISGTSVSGDSISFNCTAN